MTGQEVRELAIARGDVAEARAGHPDGGWRQDAGFVGQEFGGEVPAHGQDAARLAVQRRPGPGAAGIVQGLKQAGALVRLAHGDEGDVVVREGGGQGFVVADEIEVEGGVGAFQQEVDRSVGHEVARRAEGQQARAAAVAMHGAEMTNGKQDVVLQGQGLILLSHQLEQQGQVEGGAHVRLGGGGAGLEVGGQGIEVLAPEDPAGQLGQPQADGRSVLP